MRLAGVLMAEGVYFSKITHLPNTSQRLMKKRFLPGVLTLAPHQGSHAFLMHLSLFMLSMLLPFFFLFTTGVSSERRDLETSPERHCQQ